MTREELDALPEGTVVIDPDHDEWTKNADGCWVYRVNGDARAVINSRAMARIKVHRKPQPYSPAEVVRTLEVEGRDPSWNGPDTFGVTLQLMSDGSIRWDQS